MANTNSIKDIIVPLCGEIGDANTKAIAVIKVQRIGMGPRVIGHMTIFPRLTTLAIPFEVEGTIFELPGLTSMHLTGHDMMIRCHAHLQVAADGKGTGGFEWGNPAERVENAPATLKVC